jgi:hypothetical protein
LGILKKKIVFVRLLLLLLLLLDFCPQCLLPAWN